MKFTISTDHISVESIFALLRSDNPEIALSEASRNSIVSCREFLVSEIQKSGKPIYGVNTGFGSLCNTVISTDKISELQENLVISHACGMGDVVSLEISKLMLLLKVINLSYGHSGVSIEVMDRLIFFYNNEIVPVIFEQGSLGASGDLAPLAHLSLPLLGRGEVWFKGERSPASSVLEEFNLNPIELGAKEGLALLNGTQFMLAYAINVLNELDSIRPSTEIIAAASLDAFDCLLEPFSEEIHRVRAHEGQVSVAKKIRDILEGSELVSSDKSQVQDPYSFRCIPQVHGASIDTIEFVTKTIERELKSVTDNPIIFPEEGKVISGGNFHGQPLALALDFLAIAIAELANISERRVYKLISGQRQLPAFLTPNPGLNSGLMIAQYTAASMVSQNKQLCTPSSVDSIDSSNGQEDHVSMGGNAALKCLRVLRNYKKVAGIELLAASQALHFRSPKKSSPIVESYLAEFRKIVPFIKHDVEMHLLLNEAECFLSRN